MGTTVINGIEYDLMERENGRSRALRQYWTGVRVQYFKDRKMAMPEHFKETRADTDIEWAEYVQQNKAARLEYKRKQAILTYEQAYKNRGIKK